MKKLILLLGALIGVCGLSCVVVAAWCFYNGDHVAAALWVLNAHLILAPTNGGKR